MVDPPFEDVDPDLAEVMAAWPVLPPAKRRVILGIVRGRPTLAQPSPTDAPSA